MPLGASRLNFLAKLLEEPVISRTQVGLTAVGNAQVDTAISKFGGASALFDGNDGINADNPLIPATDNWTVEGWFYPTNIGGLDYLWAQYATSQSGRITGYNTVSGQVGLFINGGPSIVTVTTLSNNNWYHLAFTRSGSNFAIYINGVSSATGTGTPSIYQGQPFVIGEQDTVGTNGFIGQIDDIRVSSTVRYTSNFTPPTAAHINDSDTILLAHMNGTDGSTDFFDDIGVRAQVGLSAVNNAQVDTAQSKFGGASALFDGTDDQINASDSAFVYGTNDLTIEFWFRVAVNNVNQSFVGNRYSTFLNDHWFISLRGSTGDVQLQIQTAADYRTQILTSAVNTNTWYHFAAVRDGNTFEVFLDGVSQGTGTNTGSIGTSDLYIGSRGDLGLDVNGHIDELRISSVARYTANFTPQTSAHVNDSDTILLAHMNGTDGSTTFTDDNS